MAASPRYSLGSTLVIANERLADMARNPNGNEVTNKKPVRSSLANYVSRTTENANLHISR